MIGDGHTVAGVQDIDRDERGSIRKLVVGYSHVLIRVDRRVQNAAFEALKTKN